MQYIDNSVYPIRLWIWIIIIIFIIIIIIVYHKFDMSSFDGDKCQSLWLFNSDSKIQTLARFRELETGFMFH